MFTSILTLDEFKLKQKRKGPKETVAKVLFSALMFCSAYVAFLITTEITENTEMSGRDVPLYNNAFFKKALL